jgi:Tol biopolymer transport system component
MRVSSSGGTPVPVTELDKGKLEATNRFAQLLPGGEGFLFTASRNNNVWEDATIQVQNIKTGRRKTLLTGGYFGRYIASPSGTGYLMYVRDGTVFAAPMDLKRLEVTSAGSPVLEDVATHAPNGYAELDFTPTGTLVYVAGSTIRSERSLRFMDASGKLQPLSAAPATYLTPRWSPDGSRIVVRIIDGSSANISVYEWATNRMTRLTFIKGNIDNSPTWAPDSKHIVFPITSNELSGPGLYWMRADGAGEPQRLLATATGADLPYSFSPDGKRLAYAHIVAPDFGIWTLPLDLADPEHPKPGKPELFVGSKSPRIGMPAFSPDGKWIAYFSGDTLPIQVFVRPFPAPASGSRGQWQISTDGGQLPMWSRNGGELFYMTPGGPRVVSYTARGDSFVASQPRPWSDKLPLLQGPSELSPDGKRLVVAMPASEGPEQQTHVTFLLNFAQELERRVSLGK